MRKFSLLILISLCSIIAVAQRKETQTKDTVKLKSLRDQNFYFLEQTLFYSALSYVSPPYMELGSPKDAYVLSADIIPQFVIGGDWMKFPIHLTPRYKVRIFKNNPALGDSSMPVRTPCFMPGGTIHFRLTTMDDSKERIKYASLSFFHYSNGQDGNSFNSTGEINTYNGNFSTNYFEPAYHFRRRNTFKIRERGKEGVFSHVKEDYYDFYGRIGFEIPIGTAEEIESSYGGYRLNVTLGLVDVLFRKDKYEANSYFRERNRFVINTTIIASDRDKDMSALKKRINFDMNYYWRVPSSPNTSVFFTAGYYGSDPYNIYYMDSYGFIRAGLAFGFFVVPVKKGEKEVNRRLPLFQKKE